MAKNLAVDVADIHSVTDFQDSMQRLEQLEERQRFIAARPLTSLRQRPRLKPPL